MKKNLPEARIALVYTHTTVRYWATHWSINADGTGVLCNDNYNEKLKLTPNPHLLHILIPEKEEHSRVQNSY